MGSSKDVIYSYAERSLKKTFPESEGWSIQRNYGGDSIVPDYLISRKWRGISEYALAAVMMSPVVEEKDLEVFYASLPGMKKAASRKTVIVPQGAVLSAVPGDIDVLELKGFSCEDDRIVWEKRRLPSVDESE